MFWITTARVWLGRVVTEPDLSGKEAAAFVRELQQVVKRCGASRSPGHGELRVDVNVSVTQEGKRGARRAEALELATSRAFSL